MSIDARVATVLSRRDVAFNAGSDQGVEEGDIATVVQQTEVTDPETRESLGLVRRAAVRLRIIEVQPKLSVGRTYETIRPQSAFGGITFAVDQEIVQVTGSASGADYRTVQVRPGDEVEIEHAPEPEQEVEEEA